MCVASWHHSYLWCLCTYCVILYGGLRTWSALTPKSIDLPPLQLDLKLCFRRRGRLSQSKILTSVCLFLHTQLWISSLWISALYSYCIYTCKIYVTSATLICSLAITSLVTVMSKEWLSNAIATYVEAFHLTGVASHALPPTQSAWRWHCQYNVYTVYILYESHNTKWRMIKCMNGLRYAVEEMVGITL